MSESAMEIDSVNSPSNSSVRDNLLMQAQQDQTSRRRKKIKFIFTLIITFTLIIASIISVFTIMKRNFESELPAKNPVKAIKSVCSFTPYYETCSTSLSSLYKKNPSSNNINASQIFSFSLFTAVDELTKLSATLPESDHCQQILNNSLHYLNSSLPIVDIVGLLDEKSFVVSKRLREFTVWLHREGSRVDDCLSNLMFRYDVSATAAINSLRILMNMQSISEMFDPINGRMLAAFLSDVIFVDTLCIFGVQYILLLLLFSLLLHLV